MVSVIFMHFDDAQSGLSKALKDLLGNLLSSYPQGDGRRGFMEGLTERVLVGIGSGGGKKVGYYVLEVLVRKGAVGAAWAMGRYRELGSQEAAGEGDVLVGDMLSCLKDRTLSPSIGKALVSLLSARKREMAAAGTQNGWIGLWEAPLRGALASEELRGNVQIYALPGLFKLSPESFRVFVEGLGLLRYSAEGSEAVEEDSGDGEELISLLCCLKVGKDLGFVDELSTYTCNNPIYKTPPLIPLLLCR